MTRPALTAEQRAAYKTRADRVHVLLGELDALELWQKSGASTVTINGKAIYSELANRAWKVGIDALIAQLNQQLADLDAGLVTAKQIERHGRPLTHAEAHATVMAQGEQAAAELADERREQIERYPVVSQKPRLAPGEPRPIAAIPVKPCIDCGKAKPINEWCECQDAIPATLAEESHCE